MYMYSGNRYDAATGEAACTGTLAAGVAPLVAPSGAGSLVRLAVSASSSSLSSSDASADVSLVFDELLPVLLSSLPASFARVAADVEALNWTVAPLGELNLVPGQVCSGASSSASGDDDDNDALMFPDLLVAMGKALAALSPAPTHVLELEAAAETCVAVAGG
jgi:hypothetical protein